MTLETMIAEIEAHHTPPPPPMLSHAQLEALVLAAEGLTYAQIGRRLFISEMAVKDRVRNAGIKLGTRNITHTVATALRRGLLPEGTRA